MSDMNRSFRPGQRRLDSDGRPIEAHQGCVLHDGGVYYWYGADFRGPTIPLAQPRMFSWYRGRGTNVYRSTDLYNGKLAGQTCFVLKVGGREGAFIYMADKYNAASEFAVEDFTKAAHIRLPIELPGPPGTMRVRWHDEWDLSVFDVR